MLKPIQNGRCVLRLSSPRGPPSPSAQKENQGTTGGNPNGDTLASRNRTRFPAAFSYLFHPQSNTSGNRESPSKGDSGFAVEKEQNRHWKDRRRSRC